MHAALLAEERGMKGFELAPGRKKLEAFFVRFGNPGDPGMPAQPHSMLQLLCRTFPTNFLHPNPKVRRPIHSVLAGGNWKDK
jgi:hypothetical protein